MGPSIDAATRFVIASDVSLSLAEELLTKSNDRLICEAGDVAITRLESRVATSIVDAQFAAFLSEFSVPSTIVEAVIRFSRKRKIDSETLLESIFPLVLRLVGSGVLCEAEPLHICPGKPRAAIGQEVEGWTVLSALQELDDSAVYCIGKSLGKFAALKVVSLESKDLITFEVEMLKAVGAAAAPRVLHTGTTANYCYSITEWFYSRPVSVAASEVNDRSRILELCVSILKIFEALHRQGIVHGDVHPNNIVVGRDGQPMLLDFGMASSRTMASPKRRRAGVGFFYDPEYAECLLENRAPTTYDACSEQYSLAVLLYLLIVGNHYIDFSLERDTVLRQIVTERPLSFHINGAEPWPAVESVLRWALSKDPRQRFESVGAFAEALSRCSIQRSVPPFEQTDGKLRASQYVDDVLEAVRAEGADYCQGLGDAPRCSLFYGAAGVAFALLRIARARGQSDLLFDADLWCQKALRESFLPGAFENDAIDVRSDIVGPSSPFHTLSGVHAVQAHICHAMGDIGSREIAVQAFIEVTQNRAESLDATLGRSSSLLGCALLSDICENESLRRQGDSLAEDITREIESLKSINRGGKLRYLGVAHGWAGVLYALMTWADVQGRPIAPLLDDRLEELAGLALPTSRGLFWPILVGTKDERPDHMAGWCHGSAGYCHLWTLASRLTGKLGFLDLALGAAWNTWEEADQFPSLCCGLAGRAYALLNVYRFTKDAAWLSRASELASRATEAAFKESSGRSLFKGPLGVAVLLAEMSAPESAAMPFFEREGWAA